MKLFPIFAASAVLASAASANVSTRIVVTGSGVTTAHISYADLNVASDAGRTTLTRRIKAAASYLCLDSSVEPLATDMERLNCYRAALTSGANQMEAIVATGETGTAAGGH
jgi:UrcA family protein